MNQKAGKKKRKEREREAARLRGEVIEPSPDAREARGGLDAQGIRREKLISASKSIGLFLAGVVATLVFQNVFVSALPRARFGIAVRDFPSMNEPCKVYLALIENDEEIERFNVKLPIPFAIDGYVIGPSEETVIDDKYQHRTKIDQDSTGKCTVEDESRNNYLNLTAAAAGTTLSIQGTDIPRNTFAIAWVVGRPEHKAVQLIAGSTDPATARGQYSYLRLGQLVTKDVPITYGKWGDPLPWDPKRK